MRTDASIKKDGSYDLVICREVLEHLTVLEVKKAVANMVRLTSKFIYVTTRFHPNPPTLLDFNTSDDLDPSHITLLNKDMLRLMFVLEGCRSRPDLEARMDWGKKGPRARPGEAAGVMSPLSPARSRAAVLALAAVLAAALAYDLWRMPVQVSDSLTEILDAQASPSIAASFGNAVGTNAYLRPLRIAQIKALFDLAGGRYYHLVYRGFHALLIVLLIWLFARALPVESPLDAAAAAVALTVLTGAHTFLSFLREAFPINHFLEIAVLVLLALNLTLSNGGLPRAGSRGWLIDVLAGLTLVFAALTLESGVLVWVVIATAWGVGLRGVSTRGLVLVTALLAGYFLLRFVYLDTGLPSLTERTSGYFLERLEPAEIQQRFGDRAFVFYAYNVAASLLSMLFAEPRDGFFAATRSWRSGDVPPQVYLTVLSSLAMTTTMVFAALHWWRRGSTIGRSGRLAIVAAVVVAANAALSFSYTKDDIIAVAGVFYAFMAFAAVRTMLEYAEAGGFIRGFVVTMAMVALASAWAMRSSGVHHVVNEHAFRTRNDWADMPIKWQREGRWPKDPRPLALIERLRNDALEAEVPNLGMLPEWRSQWYGD